MACLLSERVLNRSIALYVSLCLMLDELAQMDPIKMGFCNKQRALFCQFLRAIATMTLRVQRRRNSGWALVICSTHAVKSVTFLPSIYANDAIIFWTMAQNCGKNTHQRSTNVTVDPPDQAQPNNKPIGVSSVDLNDSQRWSTLAAFRAH